MQSIGTLQKMQRGKGAMIRQREAQDTSTTQKETQITPKYVDTVGIKPTERKTAAQQKAAVFLREERQCTICNKWNHFAKVCRSKQKKGETDKYTDNEMILKTLSKHMQTYKLALTKLEPQLTSSPHVCLEL